MWIQTPKETNYEIRAKRCAFSLVFDIDIEKPCSFNVELKFPIDNF